LQRCNKLCGVAKQNGKFGAQSGLNSYKPMRAIASYTPYLVASHKYVEITILSLIKIYTLNRTIQNVSLNSNLYLIQHIFFNIFWII